MLKMIVFLFIINIIIYQKIKQKNILTKYSIKDLLKY